MIRSVRLVNWKSHVDSKLDFSPGVNALIGINGAGKSSVLDAISYALFGTFPNLKAKRLTTEDLIMKKPDKKEYCFVELSFNSSGDEYSVKRMIERGGASSKAEMRKNGQHHESGAELVTGEVVRAIQMDYDLFSKAVYSEQNGMDYFLRVQKGKRMDEIDRMLKVDRFEDVRAGAVSIAGRIKSASDEKMRVIADMERENLDEKLRSLSEDVTASETELKSIGAVLQSVSSQKSAVEKQLSSMESAEAELNDARFALESVKSSLSAATESLQSKKDKLGGKSKSDVESELKALESGVGDVRRCVAEAESKLLAKRQEMAELNARVRVEESAAAGLEKLGAKCPTCEAEVTDERKKRLCSAHRDAASSLRAKADAIASESAKHGEELECLRLKLPPMERELAKLSALASEFDELALLEKKVTAYSRQKESLENRVTILSKDYDKEKLTALRLELRKVGEEEAALSSKSVMLSRRLVERRALLKEAEMRVATLGKYKKDVEASSNAVAGMNGFVKVLKLTQEQLRAEFLKSVNSILGDIWKLLYPYGDFTGIRLSAEDDYSLQLQETGVRAADAASSGWIGVEAVSGGERSIAALALRIAFSRAFLPNLKWLILDEPTHNLDANAIKQFSEILREKMGMFAEQVFLITHEERISEGVTGNLYRLERDKENEGVTKAVAV